jgi:uncharacterized protein (DUF486 family)
MHVALQTTGLLILSNVFMTFAWYGHLRYKSTALALVVVASWGIAFFEYCLQVPANRIGHGYFTAPQLKVIQEVITFSVFMVFSWFYLRERPTLYDTIAFALIAIGVAVAMLQPRATA